MKRPGGVIAVAIVAILGSLATLGLGALMGLSYIGFRANPGAFQPPPGMAAPPIDLATALLAEAAIFAALGVFGLISAIALILLKNWARVAFLVFAGIVLTTAVFGILGLAVIWATSTAGSWPGVPADTMPPGAFTVILVMTMTFEALFAGLAVWWLVYLTRQPSRIVFMGEEAAARPRRGPLSLTILGWVFLVSGCVSPALLLLPSYPVLMFGFVLRGWVARAVMGALCLAVLFAGVGLLRWWPKAHSVALGIFILGAINAVSFLVIPGAIPRFQEMMKEYAPGPGAEFILSPSYFWFAIPMGLVFVIVPIYLLTANRRRFLDACAAGE